MSVSNSWVKKGIVFSETRCISYILNSFSSSTAWCLVRLDKQFFWVLLKKISGQRWLSIPLLPQKNWPMHLRLLCSDTQYLHQH